MKKRGFGAGRFNGFGGKVKSGESLRQATKRELEEEAGITIDGSEFIECGDLEFTFQDKPEWHFRVHIFLATLASSTPQESDEMRPEWFEVEKIPYEMMWVDDQYWLPLVLKGRYVYGDFQFSGDQKTVLKKNLRTSALQVHASANI